ncbi:protein HOTHEAD-like [Malania oleifera]|uniref:protein HOTHEAD-like n=1 Tax=Malania oleifera TaxID=397392 RepID=UPI0025ADF67B|nr:protein HOTHEAD-like [Malania oleifera]
MGRVWGYCRFNSAAFAATLFFYGLCYSDKAPNYSFLHDARSAPANAYYDYIIIGGGTAACALAATLSQGARVVVLERGGSPYGNPNVYNVGSFAASLADVSPSSPSQPFVSEDGVYNSRARVLGGGTALNAGFYSRASAEYVAEAGWDPQGVAEAYRWVEGKVVFEPEVKEWQAAVKDGLLEVGVLPDNGFTYEHLYGTKIGGSIFDRSGHRHTAADLLEYADPGRIAVYLHATVQRVLLRTIGNPRPRAYGVVFKDALGVMHGAFLNNGPNNEVIVSAGAMGSPQMLMLSGIGPSDQLKAHGIEVVLEQPMVGQRMADNPMNAIYVPSPRPVEVALLQAVGITRSDSYIEAASGLSFGPISPQAQLAKEAAQPTNLTQEQARATATANASTTFNSSLQSSTMLRGGIILEKVNGPLSSGHLRLLDRDPNTTPSVVFNYFQHPDDLRKCVEGMSTITKLVMSEAFSKFRYPDATVQGLLGLIVAMPVNLRPRRLTAALSLEKFCVDTVLTIWHYHGGCQVGAVVDAEYRVIGVDALRVVDGSTFNSSPGTNPQATVMMLGRYVGERILNERLNGGGGGQ